jgi:hypothetical protein
MLVCLLAAMHAIVFYNAARHFPSIEPDGSEHIHYAVVLSTGRLPNIGDTTEFFSPPLPYAFPAALLAAGVGLYKACKAAQFSQAALSLIASIFLLKTCDLVWPGRDGLKLAALGLLAMTPVYYKTVAMIRGEAFTAGFAVIFVYLVLRWIANDAALRGAILPGIIGGLLLLSRQWGAGVIGGSAAAIFLPILARRRPMATRLAGGAAIFVAISIAIAAPFYLSLQHRFGSVLAFNRTEQSVGANHLPRQTWNMSGLFTDPIIHHFDSQALPIFYSDTWGDYRGWFSVYGRSTITGDAVRPHTIPTDADPLSVKTNRAAMGPYLGRVNLVSLLPTGLMLAALGLGTIAAFRRRPQRESDDAMTLIAAVVWATMGGYILFVIRTPTTHFDTIKATYVVQIFPMLALLSAGLFARLAARRRVVIVLSVLLLAVALHNLGACFTRYTFTTPFFWT